MLEKQLTILYLALGFVAILLVYMISKQDALLTRLDQLELCRQTSTSGNNSMNNTNDDRIMIPPVEATAVEVSNYFKRRNYLQPNNQPIPSSTIPFLNQPETWISVSLGDFLVPYPSPQGRFHVRYLHSNWWVVGDFPP